MADLRRMMAAAASLSRCLLENSISHGFYGSVMTSLMGSGFNTEDVSCIVERGPTGMHPFRRVREALEGNDQLAVTNSPWTNRLFITYTQVIPPITIEILPAGEEGPRRLDSNTVTPIRGVPFLNITEFIRAKLRAWTTRGLEQDAHDLLFMLTRYWTQVDINRIPDADMERFVSQHEEATTAWDAIKAQYENDSP
ncbi:hypothetical protein SISNIDRAFT_529784 [Sistotremastrum niveocremeum HHB9708]|uniref:Uncharacterized protein n=2 Tax=Sistotremastraceae TaxID=3402574 RepID=A0A164YWY1_9AGAM|nr:hypothetical protein SISNIDRAFT_529784 [Sistotremastrum niveocremeum HHB9708]KZT36476.1 hypothetical protein SISSUDRAFT_989161 [Sistotremastrum suecicum HHB10207 ss-3]